MSRLYLPGPQTLIVPDPEISAAILAHAALADPHTGYRLESADHTHESTGLQAGKIDHGLALNGLADDDHTQYKLRSEAVDRGAAVTKSATQTVATATTTLITWNTTIADDGGYFDDANDRFTIPSGEAGWYVFHSTIVFTNGATPTTGNRIIVIRKNGTDVSRNLCSLNVDNTTGLETALIDEAAVGDDYDVHMFQNSGNDITVQTTSRFEVVRMGRYFS